MMSLRQRHIDPQLAMGSQRLVESCLSAGQQGEGTSQTARSRARRSRSHSFGQLECLPLPPLSSALSHPSVICTANPNPQSLSSLLSSSSCLPSSVGGSVASHSSHLYHSSFQPMDPIPDFSDVSQAHNSLGYQFLSIFHTHGRVIFFIYLFFAVINFNPYHLLFSSLFFVSQCLMLY